MTETLLDESSAACERRKVNSAQRKLLIGTGLCLAFMCAEIVGGLMAHSLAIIADAAHMLSDIAGWAAALSRGRCVAAHDMCAANPPQVFGWGHVALLDWALCRHQVHLRLLPGRGGWGLGCCDAAEHTSTATVTVVTPCIKRASASMIASVCSCHTG